MSAGVDIAIARPGRAVPVAPLLFAGSLALYVATAAIELACVLSVIGFVIYLREDHHQREHDLEEARHERAVLQQEYDRLVAPQKEKATLEKRLQALRDKANLAIGYARLQSGQPAAARAAFERVRLSGPQSSKALLGAGWADAAARQFESALLPWQELQGRNLLDAAVQESYLAVPYAFAELGAMAQAVEYYERAITAYDAERARINEAIAAIRSGRLLATSFHPEVTGEKRVHELFIRMIRGEA